MKKKYKLIAVVELLLSLCLMYLAGMNPASSAVKGIISIMFGIGSLISLGLFD